MSQVFFFRLNNVTNDWPPVGYVCSPSHDKYHFQKYFNYLGREIFVDPITLVCSHSVCRKCVAGLRKSSVNSSNIKTNDCAALTFPASSNIHHENNLYCCAVCRQECFGFIRSPELQMKLNTLTGKCLHCSESFNLMKLRDHSDKCFERKSPVVYVPKLSTLSQSQADAMKKAQDNQNRSTFRCPFCERNKYDVLLRTTCTSFSC